MKRWYVPIVLGCCVFAAAEAESQTAPVARADAAGFLGWLNAAQPDLDDYDHWYHRSLFAGGSAGWYWTDHLKTEIDAGITTEAQLNAAPTIVVDNRILWRFSRYRFSTRRLGVSQQFQAFRNAWFHPHAGAGIDLNWETTSRTDDPVFAYDLLTGQQRLISDARTLPPRTNLHVRPFAAFGFKGYLTERAFFRTDVRLVFDHRVREVVVRFGFGGDF